MALGNYMFDDSYLRVNRFVFSKFEKYMTCSLHIYAASKKGLTQPWASREISVSGNHMAMGISLATEPPDNPQDGDAYLLQGDLQGVWQNYPNHIASWDSLKNDWNYWIANSWHDMLYFQDTETYVTLKDNILTPCICFNDVRIWNKFFSTDVIEESNHTKQFYLYLKSLDEFKDCVDC